jgi:hypothetical protein
MLIPQEQEALVKLLAHAGADEDAISELIGVVGSCIFRLVDHAPEDNQDVVIKVCTITFCSSNLHFIIKDPFAESIAAIKARCSNFSEENVQSCMH